MSCGAARVPRLVAILDWELATVGDPLLDLAYLACSLPREGACHTPVQDLAAALLEAGCPEPQTVIARYFAQTGARRSISAGIRPW
ncbi:phosphotransferase [Novosphingobium resinovorum]